jgi:gliding motility-associated protein GldL
MAVNKKDRQGKLDWLNFAYGVGAAIVIIGAMFKFLNWQYASTMLLIGLLTEAIVFFVSAFEWKREDVMYRWERIFPQLTREGETRVEQLEQMLDKANMDPMIIERLTRSIEKLEENVGKMNGISETVALNEHIGRMKQTSENFEREITKLNTSISEMNAYYVKMLEVMGNKKSA